MQPRDGDDQCPQAGAGDGGRDAEQRTLAAALGVAAAMLADMGNRQVRVDNGVANLSVRMTGMGGTAA